MGLNGRPSRPEPLGSHHHLDGFDSGEASLDEWLRRRARANQVSGASRTFVAALDGEVIAYYALASGALVLRDGSGRFRRNMPDPIPVALLGRLAVDRRWQRRGIARALLQDCAERIAHAASVLGIRGLVTHALSEDARAFYVGLGFDASPVDRMTLMVTVEHLRELSA